MFIPARLLNINITAIQQYATWTSTDLTDPYIGNPYQWQITFDVASQSHSSPSTRTPFSYDGNDIAIGDWFGDVSSGSSLQIVQFVSQGYSSVTLIAEDIDRYNTFTDPSGQGSGACSTGNGFVFQIADDGLPILTPLTTYYTSLSTNLAWQLDQTNRFRYRNLLHSYYRVNQSGNTFAIGDVLHLIANGTYAKVNPATSTVVAAVGAVSSTGIPGPDWFSFRPVGRVVEGLSPILPGVPGDLIYLTANGTSNVAPSQWSVPQYIQLANAAVGIALNRGVDTAGSLGYVSRTYVVPDQATANATLATTNLGDQIMVDNAGFGEWTHYVVHSNALRSIATQDSARVDAESLEINITPSTVLANVMVAGVGFMSAVLMGNVSANRTVTGVSVQVTAAFTSNAVLSVGTPAVADLIIPNALIDLTANGVYANSPSVEFTGGYTPVYAFINYNGSTTGNAAITVSYV